MLTFSWEVKTGGLDMKRVRKEKDSGRLENKFSFNIYIRN